MKLSCQLLCLLLGLCVAGVAAANQSEEDAESLLRALIIEVESAGEGCQAVVDRVEKAIYANESLIEKLILSKDANSGELAPDLEQRSVAVMARIKECAGEASYSDEMKDIVNPIGERFKRPKSIMAMSESSCKNDCCVKGWETWAMVAFYSTACLGGSNQACCMATTIASYSACVDTYCPTNNCCADVPVSVPPPLP